MTGDGGDGRRLDVSAGEFRALFDAVSTWGRWGDRDQDGALHHLDPAHIVAAARLVRDGATVTLSLPLSTKAAAHNPKPAVHHMTMLPDVDIGSGSLRFAMDYLAFDYHSDTYSHIDALCHVAFEGRLYNGHPAAGITSRGAAVHGIEALKDGLVGRGVLLDIPRLRGASWLEPGEHVLREELMATIARDLAPWSSVKLTRYTASSGSLATMPVSDWPAARYSSDSVTGRQPTARSATLLHRQSGFLPAEQERHQRTP
jgi:hypothetical protein